MFLTVTCTANQCGRIMLGSYGKLRFCNRIKDSKCNSFQICTTCNLFHCIQLVSEFDGAAKGILVVSIILDSILFATTGLGIYGGIFYKKWPLKLVSSDHSRYCIS